MAGGSGKKPPPALPHTTQTPSQTTNTQHPAENALISAIQNAARSLLSGPCRLPTLQRLAFLAAATRATARHTFSTHRSLFYEAPAIFRSQRRVLTLLNSFSRSFNRPPSALFIRPGLKGFYIGTLAFHTASPVDSKEVPKEFSKTLSNEFSNDIPKTLSNEISNEIPNEIPNKIPTTANLIPHMDSITRVSLPPTTTRILIAEKETVAAHLASPETLVVCGKGYPCRNTLRLLQLILLASPLPLLCLTDLDPFGLHIAATYARVLGPRLVRIGLASADLFRWPVLRSQGVPLRAADRPMLRRLLGRAPGGGGEGAGRLPCLVEESEFLEGLGLKFELEALVNQPEFFVEGYLREKAGRSE